MFTTRFVIEGRPITQITHEEDDGAWQFFSDDRFENFEDVAKVVALEEIIAMDEFVLDIADMPVGHYATRRSSADAWVVFAIGGQ